MQDYKPWNNVSNPTDSDDILVGTRRDFDFIKGGKGNDYIFGRAGLDDLYGGKGHDTIIAGKGNDNIYGGKGDDLLTGGPGFDRFKPGKGHDVITDLERNDALVGKFRNREFIEVEDAFGKLRGTLITHKHGSVLIEGIDLERVENIFAYGTEWQTKWFYHPTS